MLLGNRLGATSHSEPAIQEAAVHSVGSGLFFLKELHRRSQAHIYGHQLEGWEANEREQGRNVSWPACDWSAKRVVPGRDLWFSSGLRKVNFQLQGKTGPFNNLVAVKPLVFPFF